MLFFVGIKGLIRLDDDSRGRLSGTHNCITVGGEIMLIIFPGIGLFFCSVDRFGWFNLPGILDDVEALDF